MNTSTHEPQVRKRILKKSSVLLSLFALVAIPLFVLGAIYGTPIVVNNPTPAISDLFGWSVAMDENKFIVGAPLDNTGAQSAGSAYLYDATTGTLLHMFNNPTPEYQDYFGEAVSISDDKVLIGASSDSTGVENAGSAYLYDATTGTLLHTFNNPTPEAEDHFGTSVSISNDRILIGAPFDNTGAASAGSAYLYDATTFALLHTFNNPTPELSDVFGSSVSMSGSNVLIGAFRDDTVATDAGSAYLYDATTGTLLHTFNNPTPEASDHFGTSVFISSDSILIGAPLDNTGVESAGSAYLYDATTFSLLHTFNNPAPEYQDQFGNAVSVYANRILIGALLEDIGTAINAGSAYLFADTGTLLKTFNNPTPAGSDHFGGSVSLVGEKVLIGAQHDDTGAEGAGSSYLYLPQTDTDDDGIADGSDNCPADYNPEQTDADGDGQGDPCDTTPNGDTDGDGVDGLIDNCQGVYNPGQEDNDGDGIGNACDLTPDGDPDPDPTTTDECKNTGWMAYGFRNQGQCVSFVNTGLDSRE